MRQLLTGDEAVALAARDASFTLAVGHPGASVVLDALDGRAHRAPNEQVALDLGVGVASAGGRALVAVRRAGLAALRAPSFAASCGSVTGALVLLATDGPPGSAHDDEDVRRCAADAGLPLLEPADAQEAYDHLLEAVSISERYRIPVLLRLARRVARTRSVTLPKPDLAPAAPAARLEPLAAAPPGGARAAQRQLRRKLERIADVAELLPVNRLRHGDDPALAVVAAGVARLHAREAAPAASVLELALVHPLPMKVIRELSERADRCVVIEEGAPVLADAIRAAGVPVESTPERFRAGELDVARVRRILQRDPRPEPAPPRAGAPEECAACRYQVIGDVLRRLDVVVAGDVGPCGPATLPPGGADSLARAGAAIAVGLGLRHALPDAAARRVVSVVDGAGLVDGGVTGLVEMVYNPPASGHVVLVLDGGATAMTGHGDDEATGRMIEALARSCGIAGVDVVDPAADRAGFERLLAARLAGSEPAVIVARRPCPVAAGDFARPAREAAERARAGGDA
jgi:indolepyruvate ferredoxin oxidoreductase alpha subunit